MREIAEQWLRPLKMHDKVKDHRQGRQERDERALKPDVELEALLPSKDETDGLVQAYLDQFEQINRILHLPSFRRSYATFWDPAETRAASFTALVLVIISASFWVNECIPLRPNKAASRSATNLSTPKWIEAVDSWLERQSQKHRRLVHFQIACMLYLAKRINTTKKKRLWKGSGALALDAISVGLHQDPNQTNDGISPFFQEMGRRLWATIQYFEMQASLDHGLPTILTSLQNEADPPRNIDDDEFNEDSKELPPSKPLYQYTYTSFQCLSRQSMPLRLKLSRILTGRAEDLDYDQAIRYTHEIGQEIDSLPTWDDNDENSNSDNNTLSATGERKRPLLSYTLLHIQLRQYIIALHANFLRLRKTNSQYQYSEVVYYNAARDMVLLRDKLYQQGIRTLNFLHEDNVTLAICLANVTMLQPRGKQPGPS